MPIYPRSDFRQCFYHGMRSAYPTEHVGITIQSTNSFRRTMKKNIPTNMTDLQEEVSVYVTEVLQALVARGMSMGDEEMLDFPRLLWSMQVQETCYDMVLGIRKQQLIQDFGHYELLGKYAPAGYEITDGPTVVLYEPTLHAATEVLLFNLYEIKREDEDFEGMFSMLLERITVLVYTHEIMHWIIDQIRSADGKRMTAFNYITADEIAFHESMVQAFMVYAFREKPVMISTMAALEKGQPLQYVLYKELGADFDALFDAFQFVHSDSFQSFEVLKRAVESKIAHHRREREGELWVDLLKRPEHEVFSMLAFPRVAEILSARFPELAQTYRGTIGARRFGII